MEKQSEPRASKQLTIFEVFPHERLIPDNAADEHPAADEKWINHKRQTIPNWNPTTHFPDKPPIVSDTPTLVLPRISIPRPQILAFISGQVERLQSLYSDRVELNPVKGRSVRSPFHC